MVAGCLNKEENLITKITEITNEEEPALCIDCEIFTFVQAYLNHFQDEEIFFIRGVALDVYKHGREIKVIEDLKGNFSNNSSIFVWGMSSTSFCDNKGRQDMRIDDITKYHKSDTLIMLITNNVSENFNWDIERSNDYKTLGAHFSVLKFSNGYVTGHILPSEEKEDRWWENMSREEMISFLESLSEEERQTIFMDIMPWEEFQELLK